MNPSTRLVRVSTRRTAENFLVSECGSVDRHCCFARNSRDALDAEGRVVGREHERVRSRVTAPGRRCHWRPMYRQSSRCRYRRPCHQSAVVSLSRRLVQLHLRGKHRKRHAGNTAAYRECERRREAQEDAARHALEQFFLSSDHVGGTDLGGTLAFMCAFAQPLKISTTQRSMVRTESSFSL